MIKQDQLIIIVLIVLIVLHLAIWMVGYVGNKLPWLITLLNFLFALCILIYWIHRQLSIQQHILEEREIAVVCVELMVVGLGVFSIINRQFTNWGKVFQYVVFGIHLLALLLMLALMFTFKIKRLM